MSNPLFRPFNMAGLQLPNRVVMAPMTRSFSPNGVPGADVAAYYRARAVGEVGLIVTEGTGIDRVGSVNDPNIPRFHGDAALAGWGNVVKEVHAVGGLIAPPLDGIGNTGTEALLRNILTPSAAMESAYRTYRVTLNRDEVIDSAESEKRFRHRVEAG